MWNTFMVLPCMVIWSLLLYVTVEGTPTPVNSKLMQDVERKKALFYYNTRPMYPSLSEVRRVTARLRRMQEAETTETPSQDRIYIKPYKFPFWGLPFGIYSKAGFFNPGLFPFVPGGPGFPPFDGVFGTPTTAAPSTTPAPTPPPTTTLPPKSNGYYASDQYYYPRTTPKKKKPPPRRPEYSSCDCDSEEDYEDEECDCYYTPPETKPPKPRRPPPPPPTYNRYTPKPTQSPYNYRRKSSLVQSSSINSKKACKYGYNSGPRGGCKPPPPPTPRPLPRRRFKLEPKPVTPPPIEEDEWSDDEEYADERHDDAGHDDDEEQMIRPYIPVYVPYPIPEEARNYPQPPTTTTPPPPTPPTTNREVPHLQYQQHTSSGTSPQLSPTPLSPYQHAPADSHSPDQYQSAPDNLLRQAQYHYAPNAVAPQDFSHSQLASIPPQVMPMSNEMSKLSPSLIGRSDDTVGQLPHFPNQHYGLPFQEYYPDTHYKAPSLLNANPTTFDYVESSYSSSGGDKNLRAINSDESFIANVLNNYTATSLQMQLNNSTKPPVKQDNNHYNHKSTEDHNEAKV